MRGVYDLFHANSPGSGDPAGHGSRRGRWCRSLRPGPFRHARQWTADLSCRRERSVAGQPASASARDRHPDAAVARGTRRRNAAKPASRGTQQSGQSQQCGAGTRQRQPLDSSDCRANSDLSPDRRANSGLSFGRHVNPGLSFGHGSDRSRAADAGQLVRPRRLFSLERAERRAGLCQRGRGPHHAGLPAADRHRALPRRTVRRHRTLPG